MSILLRDPLMRELLLNEYDRDRMVRLQPIRVHRLDWPLGNSFDNALSELQSVMDNVNEAIGNYQNSFARDLGTGGMKTNRTEDGHLQVAMDVSQFKPEEVSVKICDNNLVVEAKTETSENDSYHKAEFKRWIKLPADVKHEGIKSTLTPDKKLLVEVPVHKPIADSRSRNIPIEIQKQAVEDSKKGGDQQKQNGQQNTQAKKILDWFKRLFWQEEMELTLVGLHNSGKTTFVNVIASGQYTEDMIPTVGFNMRRVTKGHVTIKIWDIGGQPRFRSMWVRYCRGVNAIIYMVDAADHVKVEESRTELQNLLEKPELAGIPVLVLGNKRDLPNALDEKELITRMNLSSINDREICCFSISCKDKSNIDITLEWLTKKSKSA